MEMNTTITSVSSKNAPASCKWHPTPKILTFHVGVSTVPTSVISLPPLPPPNIFPTQPTQEATAKLVGTCGDSPAGGGVAREGGGEELGGAAAPHVRE